MLGMLEIVFSCDRITRRLGVTRKLLILFGNMMRRSPHLYIRPIGFIDPGQGVGAATIIIAAPHTLRLTISHQDRSLLTGRSPAIMPGLLRHGLGTTPAVIRRSLPDNPQDKACLHGARQQRATATHDTFSLSAKN